MNANALKKVAEHALWLMDADLRTRRHIGAAVKENPALALPALEYLTGVEIGG